MSTYPSALSTTIMYPQNATSSPFTNAETPSLFRRAVTWPILRCDREIATYLPELAHISAPQLGRGWR